MEGKDVQEERKGEAGGDSKEGPKSTIEESKKDNAQPVNEKDQT